MYCLRLQVKMLGHRRQPRGQTRTMTTTITTTMTRTRKHETLQSHKEPRELLGTRRDVPEAKWRRGRATDVKGDKKPPSGFLHLSPSRNDISSSTRIFAPLGSLSGLSAVSTGPKTSLPFTLQPRAIPSPCHHESESTFVRESATSLSLLENDRPRLLSSSKGFLQVSKLVRSLSPLRPPLSLSLSFFGDVPFNPCFADSPACIRSLWYKSSPKY